MYSKTRLKALLWSTADIIVTFIIYFLMGVALHEYWHANVAKMLGYSPLVNFNTWFTGWVDLTPYPVNLYDIIIIGVVGGGGVAAFYALISLFTYDWETKMVLWLFAPWHGIYAVCEIFYLLEYLSLYHLCVIPIVLASIIFIIRFVISRKFRFIKKVFRKARFIY